jgi:formylglycine-generating enzyme required for sulfatase activity
MPPASWLAAGLGCLLAATLISLGPPDAKADVQPEEVDLTLGEGGRTFVNRVGMKFVRIPKGKFLMGTPRNAASEKQHEVELTKDFYLGVYEVTQGQYKQVMGVNPSDFCATGSGAGKVQGQNTTDFPVEQVNWHDAQKFVEKLNSLDVRKGAGRKYRLPTEAEWEYACRAGSDKTYHFGDQITAKDANFVQSPAKRTEKVGSYKPNKWGLYDMHGNVFEWVLDCYDADFYKTGPKRDPVCLKGATRVERGGGWYNSPDDCRAACRYNISATDKYNNLGFRVALVTER